MNIVLLSNHWFCSPRKAGFHHLAHAWHAEGHKITFATIGLSFISYLRRDYRTKYKGLWQACNVMQKVQENLFSYVHFTPWHPHTTLLAPADNLLAPYLEKYANFPLGALEAHIKEADIVVYESSVAIFLLKLCKKLTPTAKHIYRVSDDISVLRSTPQKMQDLELEIAPLFDVISAPCSYIKEKFPTPNAFVHRHGISTASFDAVQESPYALGTKNAVFVGVFNFDAESVWLMAKHNPEVHFHIIGNVPVKAGLDNVFTYGEMPFIKTLPYIKFADIGLQSRKFGPAAQSFSDSLKVIQFRYCALPIISPEFLDLQRDGVFYYTPCDAQSCAKVIQDALQSGKDAQRAKEVQNWTMVAQTILNSCL